MSRTRTVCGITLRKTLGRIHHRWCARINGISVVFDPVLGKHSNRPIFWRARRMHVPLGKQHITEATTLNLCVERAIELSKTAA